MSGSKPVAIVRVKGGFMVGASRLPGMAGLPDGDHELVVGAAPMNEEQRAWPAPPGHEPTLQEQIERVGPPWKSGNRDLQPFHPSASQVSPEYRDGWNRCYLLARAEHQRLHERLAAAVALVTLAQVPSARQENAPPFPFDPTEAQVMERWRWFRERIYQTVYGRELYDAYQSFFYDNEGAMFRLAARAQEAT